MDFFGPIFGKTYFVVVDSYSKLAEVCPHSRPFGRGIAIILVPAVRSGDSRVFVLGIVGCMCTNLPEYLKQKSTVKNI